MTANQIIVRALKGKNIMTPNVLKYGFTKKKGLAYELSTGTDFSNNDIFGVTFVDPITFKSLHDLNNMFYSKDEAISYINQF